MILEITPGSIQKGVCRTPLASFFVISSLGPPRQRLCKMSSQSSGIAYQSTKEARNALIPCEFAQTCLLKLEPGRTLTKLKIL